MIFAPGDAGPSQKSRQNAFLFFCTPGYRPRLFKFNPSLVIEVYLTVLGGKLSGLAKGAKNAQRKF